MTNIAKQFEFLITGRGVLIDPDLNVTQDNLQFTVDMVTINGVQETDLDALEIAALVDAVATVIANVEDIPASD